MSDSPSVKALAMIVRHARHRHELAKAALGKARDEEKAAFEAIEAAEKSLGDAVEAIIDSVPIGDE